MKDLQIAGITGRQSPSPLQSLLCPKFLLSLTSALLYAPIEMVDEKKLNGSMLAKEHDDSADDRLGLPGPAFEVEWIECQVFRTFKLAPHVAAYRKDSTTRVVDQDQEAARELRFG